MVDEFMVQRAESRGEDQMARAFKSQPIDKIEEAKTKRKSKPKPKAKVVEKPKVEE